MHEGGVCRCLRSVFERCDYNEGSANRPHKEHNFGGFHPTVLDKQLCECEDLASMGFEPSTSKAVGFMSKRRTLFSL